MEDEGSDESGSKPVLARSAAYPQLGAGEGPAKAGTPLDLMLDVSVTLTAEFGKAVLPLGELLKLGVGSVVQLDRLVSEPVEILVKGVLLARGEVVVVNDRFAIHIKEIMQAREDHREEFMTRRVILVTCLVLGMSLLGAAPEADLTYTPPPTPEPPSVGAVLLRLGGATLTALVLCGGCLWLVRRSLGRSGAKPAGNRLKLLSTLALGGGSHLFLLQVGQRKYVAGVGRLGVLQTLTPLNADFAQTFDEIAEKADNTAPSTLPTPFRPPSRPLTA